MPRRDAIDELSRATAALEPGDTLVIVSDGIVEARNREGDFWDETEIDRVLLANRDSLPQLPELLCAAVDNLPLALRSTTT